MGAANLRHRPGRAPVQQGEADLVGEDRQAAAHGHVEVDGVAVGQPQMPDAPGRLVLRKHEEAIQPARLGIVPGVELQEVDAVGVQPREGARNRLVHGRMTGGPRLRHPLGEKLHVIAAAGQGARDHLGRAVMVGHVEGGEPGVGVGGHRVGGRPGIERCPAPLLVGDLPEPGDDPGDPEAGGQEGARLPQGFLPQAPWPRA